MISVLSSICTVFIVTAQIDATCEPRNSSSDLRFLKEPETILSGFEDDQFTMECCMDGFVMLLWQFRKMNNFTWQRPSNRKMLDDDNRTLSIKEPYDGYDTAFYRCTGEDKHGANISRIIFAYFLKVNMIRTIKLVAPNSSIDTGYQLGTDVNLNCLGRTYDPREPVSVAWRFRNTGNDVIISREHVIKTRVKTASNRSGETNLDLVDIKSSLYLSNVLTKDGGNYSCIMSQGDARDNMTFIVSIRNDQMNLTLLLSLNVTIIMLFGCLVLMWRYHYDIIVGYKSYFDPCPRVHSLKFDVSIIYGDMDQDSLTVSLKVLRLLESQGFRCWHYDRDKVYGRDVLEDVVHSINESAVLLVILSSFSVTTEVLISKISSMAIYPAVRRLYLFIPNRKCVLLKLSGNTLKWMKQEYILRSLFQNNTFNCDTKKTEKQHYDHLSTWVIAFTPSTSIRDAIDRIHRASTSEDAI